MERISSCCLLILLMFISCSLGEPQREAKDKKVRLPSLGRLSVCRFNLQGNGRLLLLLDSHARAPLGGARAPTLAFQAKDRPRVDVVEWATLSAALSPVSVSLFSPLSSRLHQPLPLSAPALFCRLILPTPIEFSLSLARFQGPTAS